MNPRHLLGIKLLLISSLILGLLSLNLGGAAAQVAGCASPTLISGSGSYTVNAGDTCFKYVNSTFVRGGMFSVMNGSDSTVSNVVRWYGGRNETVTNCINDTQTLNGNGAQINNFTVAKDSTSAMYVSITGNKVNTVTINIQNWQNGSGCSVAPTPVSGGGPTNTPTNTPVATNTPTNTLIGPTATHTNTAIGPTATHTNTPVVPTATRTNTPTSGGATYQAESATLGGGAFVESTNGGFIGTGYVNFPITGGFVEFTNVDGGAGGNVTLQFRHALGVTTSRTGQLTVNGSSQSITFSPTGAWTTWLIHSVTVSLNSGPSNTVRLTTNGQDLANIDQLVVGSGGPTPTSPPPTLTGTPTRTNTPVGPTPTRTPTAVSGGGWPTAQGEQAVMASISVSGVFDGGMKRYYGSGPLGTGGQNENQDPIFDLAAGATLKNVILGFPAADGVHCAGACTLQNVWWEDVGEDAATFRGSSASISSLVDGGGARLASDKIFQHNGAGTLTIRNFQIENFGKLYRSCGNCSTQYQRHVVIDNITARAPGSAIAGINTNYGDTARFTRITIIGNNNMAICDKFTGNNTGAEPPKIGSGADGVNCIYSPSDITYQ